MSEAKVTDVIAKAKKVSMCVYLACEESVAKDIADTIDTLVRHLEAAEQGEAVATVVNNNVPGEWLNIVQTAPNVTLDVGTKLYAHPPAPVTSGDARERAAVVGCAQEFWWLIETNDGLPLYATGEDTNPETWIGQWTRNPGDAMRFKTRKAAERIKLRMGLFKHEENEGYNAGKVNVVEHGFIYAAPPSDDAERIDKLRALAERK